jgi:membrane protease YdiL (CAAX protease family)
VAVSIAQGLALSAVWCAAFALGRSVGDVRAVLVVVAAVALVLGPWLDPARGRAWWRGSRRDLAVDVVLGVVVGAASVLATHAAYPVVCGLFPSLGDQLVSLYALSGVTTLASTLLTCAIAAAEEVLWRGAFIAALALRGAPPGARVVGAAVVYGLAQGGAGAPWLVVAAMALGVVWGTLAVARSGRLVAGLVAHLVWTLVVLGAWPLQR